MELQFKNEVARIHYDATLPALVQVWNGFATGTPLREAHEVFLRLQQQFSTTKLLSDLRTMRVIPRADQQWILENYFPRALAGGLRTAAILTSEDAFNQVSVKNILLQLGPEEVFRTEHFQDEAAARIWLTQQA